MNQTSPLRGRSTHIARLHRFGLPFLGRGCSLLRLSWKTLVNGALLFAAVLGMQLEPGQSERQDDELEAVDSEPNPLQNLAHCERKLFEIFLLNYETVHGLVSDDRASGVFLRIAKSRDVNGQLRGYAAWALRSSEEHWPELFRLLETETSPELLLGLLQAIPRQALDQSSETLPRAVFALVRHEWTPLRRQATTKLKHYSERKDQSRQAYRLCEKRISSEEDLETLANLLDWKALQEAVSTGSPLPRRVLSLAEGSPDGLFDSPLGRRVRTAALQLLGIAGSPRTTDILLGIFNSESKLSRELLIASLANPTALRNAIRERRVEIYESLGLLLNATPANRLLIERAVLNADGAKAIKSLGEISGSPLDLRFPISQLFASQEILFAGKDADRTLADYLLKRLPRAQKTPGLDLSELCTLLARCSTTETTRALLEASRNPEVPHLAKLQLFLGWLRTNPGLIEVSAPTSRQLRAFHTALRSLDSTEVLSLLAGLFPLPRPLETRDTVETLFAILESPPSDLPAFPFLILPELHRLEARRIPSPRNLEVVSRPFLTHDDWRVRVRTAATRYLNGHGTHTELLAALDSAPHKGLLSQLENRSGPLPGRALSLQEALDQIPLASLMRNVSPAEKPRCKTEASRLRRLCARLSDHVERLRSTRREARRWESAHPTQASPPDLENRPGVLQSLERLIEDVLAHHP